MNGLNNLKCNVTLIWKGLPGTNTSIYCQMWVKPSQVESSRVKSSQVESSRVKLSRVESSRVESSRVESSRVESSRVESSQVKSSQVKSSQVESSQVKVCKSNVQNRVCSIFTLGVDIFFFQGRSAQQSENFHLKFNFWGSRVCLKPGLFVFAENWVKIWAD